MNNKRNAPLREESSDKEFFLYLDGLAIAEGHLNVIGGVDRNEVYQTVETVEVELCDMIGQFLESRRKSL